MPVIQRKSPAQEFERSEAYGSTEFAGTTKEGRRTLYLRTPNGAELMRARLCAAAPCWSATERSEALGAKADGRTAGATGGD